MCYSINCGQRRSLLPRSVGDAFFTASEISWTSFSQCGERERLWERGCNIPFFRTRNVRILQRVIISPEKYLTCKKTCYENSCVAQLCQRLFLIFAGGGWGSCNWSHIASKGMTVRVPSAPVLKALGSCFTIDQQVRVFSTSSLLVFVDFSMSHQVSCLFLPNFTAIYPCSSEWSLMKISLVD